MISENNNISVVTPAPIIIKIHDKCINRILSKKIKGKNIVLIGVSFGGIVVQGSLIGSGLKMILFLFAPIDMNMAEHLKRKKLMINFLLKNSSQMMSY